MPTEEWQPVPGFPNYRVTQQGAVVSLAGKTPRALRLWEHTNGYLRVSLCENAEKTNRYVHQLVAEAYHGPRPEGMEVRHLDGDKANNAPSNLAWGSASENSFDKVRHGTHPMANKTHCAQGHAFTPENTAVDRRGHRSCRICRRASTRLWKTRRAFRAAGIEVAA